MADQALELQNNARGQAPGGSRPRLSWSNNLASRAQAWANHLASIDKLNHNDGSTGDVAGDVENLAWFSGAGSLAAAAQMWIDEKNNYHGEKIGEGNFASYGHYTQVIWPETTSVGMAAAVSGNGGTYIVGRYAPAGNFTGTSAWRGSGPSVQPPANNGGSDGLMFLNGYQNGQLHTIVAWYKKREGNLTRFPDAQVNGEIPRWEGK